MLVSVEGKGERLLSQKHACARCDVSVPELQPRSFSFNSAQGACPACDGLGQRWAVEADRVMPDESKTLLEGAIRPWHRHGPRLLREALFEVAERHGFSLEVPVSELSAEARAVLLDGDADGFPGVVPYLRKRVETLLRLDPQPAEEEGRRRRGLRRPEAVPDPAPCPSCKGARLRPESLAVRVGGTVRRRVRAADALPCVGPLAGPLVPRAREAGGRPLIGEIVARLRLLEAVGVGYLALDRPTTTLSGGEAHRLRLAAQIGARMQGVLYVLDEPSVGLHQRDNLRLLETLRRSATSATPWSWSSTTRRRSAPRTTWWTWARARAAAGAGVMYEGPPRRPSTAASPAATSAGSCASRCPRRAGPRGVAPRSGARAPTTCTTSTSRSPSGC